MTEFPNDSIQEFSMFISKASLFNGEMRWSAINSDTDWDLYGERMSLELYRGMIAKIKSKVPPPEPFAKFITSEYWSGGMPYLSIAHYADGGGNAVPGDVKELFIDGSQLKAKGTLHPTPLGKAVWKSLKQDELNYKNSLDTDRIRISIAFLDLAHKHGEEGSIFKRESLSDVCPECRRGVGEKIYLDGYLVHLALTRVPVNPRTIMEAEDEMTKKSKPNTRKDDAVSIVGDEALVEENVIAPNLEVKSLGDAIVEMSEPEQAPVGEPPTESETVGAKSEVVEEKVEVSKSELANLVQSLVEEAMSKKKDNDQATEDDEDNADTSKKAPVYKKSALEESVDKLYNVVKAVTGRAGTAEEKLQEVQPVLEEVGQAIVAEVKSSVGITATVNAPSDAILEAIQSLKSEVQTQIQAISTEVATIKAQSTNAQPPVSRVPAPRSITPTVTMKSDVVQSQENPNSVKSIVRRSVGL